MKLKTLVIITSLLYSIVAEAQTENPLFDKQLSDSLGADEYGMKNYILVILKTGPEKIEDKKIVDSLFTQHLSNIGRLADEGKLVIAGPMKKNEKQYRGIFVLNVATTEEASELLKTDAAIKAKLLDVEIYQWYGSAALPMYLPFHDKASKKLM